MMKQLKADLKRSAKMVTQNSARYFLKRATYNRINDRRYELIDKKVEGCGLNAEETDEYRTLNAEVDRLIDLAFPDTAHSPFPPITSLEDLLRPIESMDEYLELEKRHDEEYPAPDPGPPNG